MSHLLLFVLLLPSGIAFSQPTELPDTLICLSQTQSDFALSVMAEHHAAMDKLQLLHERVSIHEVRERQFRAALYAQDSTITNLQQALSVEVRAGELCETDLKAANKRLKQEKRQKTIFAGTTVALIGAVVWMAVSK